MTFQIDVTLVGYTPIVANYLLTPTHYSTITHLNDDDKLMSGTDSAKVLLDEYNQEQYRAFTLNSDSILYLPEVSSVPWVGVSKRRDVYGKSISHPSSLCHVKFITKNDEPHSFLWQTSAEQLKKAVRWGIVKTHTITGHVIAALGQYRVVAHTRVAKGMVSNSQAVKLKLLDLFQDRFEALEDIESLVNKSNSLNKYEKVLQGYIKKLEAINNNVDLYFSEVALSGLDDETLVQIKADIQHDIQRTNDYLKSLSNTSNLSNHNTARGTHSVLEFVKLQMLHGLYELQGINQDMSYSTKRAFALTRGELNDFIEDACKVIDDHQADLRDAITPKHHGMYGSENSTLVSYDFSADQLSTARERDVLLAISFIEGWDKLNNNKNESPTVSNEYGQENLSIIHATRWRNHRNFTVLMKSAFYFILNFFKSMFVSTHPWEEETWKNENQSFHLVAADLQKNVKPNEPMWRKPLKFLKQVIHAVVDVFNGVYDFGAHLVIRMPEKVLNDWESSHQLPTLEQTLTESSFALETIRVIEEERLHQVFLRCGYLENKKITPSTSQLASVEYALTPGEQNDLLTAMVRGVNGFTSLFTHNIFAKDPLGGMAFMAAYAVGAGAIYMPALTSSILGSRYVNWFANFSYSMGASKLAAAVAGGSTQAQLFAAGWDSVVHGPSGVVMNTIHQFGEDPLTVVAYGAAAYGLGYFLANGINGHPIPWLSEMLKADLGTVPETGYPLIGAKFAIMLYEALITEHPENIPPAKGTKLDEIPESQIEEKRRIIERFRLAYWLSHHAKLLPKLEPTQRFAVSRQIHALFNKEDSESLDQLLYPETHSSIAFQIFSKPLSYIPVLLRFILSLVLTTLALVTSQPYPLEPAKRAGKYLYEKIKKDLSALLIFATHLCYLAYSLLASLAKIAAYISEMTIGRLSAPLHFKPAHPIHRVFAAVHGLFRTIGEFLYPVSVIKHVSVAHPTHTIKETEHTYIKLLKKIRVEIENPNGATNAVDNPVAEAGSLLEKDTEDADQSRIMSNDIDHESDDLPEARL